MNINTNTNHLIRAALFGLAAGLLAFYYLSAARASDRDRMEAQLAAASRPINVLTATRDLPRGTLIAKDDIRPVKSVGAYLPKDLVVNENDAVGKETAADIFAGEPLVSARIGKRPSGRGSSSIRPGHVGLAVAVDEVSGVANGVRPGDRVDVMVADEETGKTELLYSFVRVLGVSGRHPYTASSEPDESGSSLSLGGAIVLELKVRDAKVLTEAAERGAVRLALRAAN